MGVVRSVIGVVLALQALSCSLFFIPPIRIVAWSPAEERLASAEGVEVWVEFSAPVDKTKAEQAFTLKEDSALMAGRFAWRENRMFFRPLQPISAGKDYQISVADTVENRFGVSLEADFHFRFSTRSEEVRPRILSFSPSNGAVLDEPFQPLLIVFSEKVDPASLYRAFSVSPPVPGSFAWTVDGASCTFAPLQPYAWQTEYVVRIASSLSDAEGNGLAEEFRSRFRLGSDAAPPEVAGVRNLVAGAPGSILIAPDEPGDGEVTVTEGWECGWGIEVRFSEPVLREAIEGRLAFSPGWSYSIDCPSRSADAFRLMPAERLAYDTVYTLTVRQGLTDEQGNSTPTDLLYRFHTNGPSSKPPEVARLRFRLNPAEPPPSCAYADYGPTDAFLSLDLASFPVGSTVPTYIDLYFYLAQGAALNRMSLMKAFSVSATNGCAGFAVTSLQISGFDEPLPEPIEGAAVVRIGLELTTGSASGLVVFKLSGELTDSSGNPIASSWQLPLLK